MNIKELRDVLDHFDDARQIIICVNGESYEIQHITKSKEDVKIIVTPVLKEEEK